MALAHSYDISCPACHAALELSRFTRLVGAFGGIAGAFVAVHLIRGVLHSGQWVVPIMAAILAFGFISALCVLIAGDLVVRPKANSTGFPH